MNFVTDDNENITMMNFIIAFNCLINFGFD